MHKLLNDFSERYDDRLKINEDDWWMNDVVKTDGWKLFLCSRFNYLRRLRVWKRARNFVLKYKLNSFITDETTFSWINYLHFRCFSSVSIYHSSRCEIHRRRSKQKYVIYSFSSLFKLDGFNEFRNDLNFTLIFFFFSKRTSILFELCALIVSK